MCNVEKLDLGLSCNSQAEDIGVGTPDGKNIIWVCKSCYFKMADMPWPWDNVKEKLNKNKNTSILRS